MNEVARPGLTWPGPVLRSQPLRNSSISLTIRRGEVIALVGENGLRKSSLAKLLSGLYLPSSGTILWDGRDAATLDAAGRTRLMSVVSQDWWRFPFTAGRNIALGRNQHHNEPQRLVAARGFYRGAQLLICDEP